MSELTARQHRMANDLATELRKALLRWSADRDVAPGEVDMRVYTRAIMDIVEDMDEGVNQAIEDLVEEE